MKAVVLGAGGFIGGHLVKKLKQLGYWVRGADLKRPEFEESEANEFIICDLRRIEDVDLIIDDTIDEVYQLAADMGGAEYIFTGDNDADIIHNSAMINLNVCNISYKKKVKKIFYSSSACIYPEHNQLDPNNPICREDTAYPANPDSEYGWEKLFSERVYLNYMKNKNIEVRIGRFHNIFGPYGTYQGGKEKAPAALCRKISLCKDGEEIEIFGNGEQTRSFLFIDECIEGIVKLMNSECREPLNIGSDQLISINNLVNLITDISGKNIKKKHITGPLGVKGRNSDNNLIFEKLGWKPTMKLKNGLEITYKWIDSQLKS